MKNKLEYINLKEGKERNNVPFLLLTDEEFKNEDELSESVTFKLNSEFIFNINS